MKIGLRTHLKPGAEERYGMLKIFGL